MCCISLRGAAFFLSSLHLGVGLVLFLRYVVATVVFTIYNFNNLFSEKVTAFLAPFMVYVTILLVLGVLIFHSVEREYFSLLKWSSVAFSLLQLIVFITILGLKLSPNYEYSQFPFLPESFIPSTTTKAQTPEVYIAVPHGATVDENDLKIRPSSKSPSSDPPDPGGSEGDILIPINSNNEKNREKDAKLQEIYRLSILISCVLLTLIYLVFLFLYIRQLYHEGTGNVFVGQALSRSLAYYVHPQFTSTNPNAPGTQDNNSSSQPVQRSQTQIPHQFLPQTQQQQQQHQQQQQQQSSPRKMANKTTAQLNPTSSVDGSGSNLDVQRSPKRQHRIPNPNPSSLSNPHPQMQNYHHSPNPTLQRGVGPPTDNPYPPQLPILGPSPPVQQANPYPQHQQHQQHHQQPPHHHHPQYGHGPQPPPQQQQQQPMRGPIPAQVRIGFYPQDLGYDQGPRISPQPMRSRGGGPPPLPVINETETMNMQGPVVMSQSALRGPPPPPGQGHHPHPPPQTSSTYYHPPPQHHHQQQLQQHPHPQQNIPHPQHQPQPQHALLLPPRVSFHHPPDSSSSPSVHFAPNPPRGVRSGHPISMV